MVAVETLWFALVGFMLTMYVLLDGFDLGAGAIHPFVAKSDDERKLVIEAIGPVWDGNEVWLIAAGGTLFFSFPRLYAASFSGFYLPLMVVLWLLMGRGVAIELRSRGNAVWSAFWDAMFFLSSSLLAIFLGVAIANVVRGVPLDANGYFFEPLWTDFNPKSTTPGILDWYTMLIGVLGLAALVLHGANFMAVRTEGEVQTRARRLAHQSWLAVVVLTVLGTVATFYVKPGLLASFGEHPLGIVLPLIAIAGLALVGYASSHERDGWRLVASGAYLAGMLASSAFILYPDVLPAVDPANSLTVFNAASPQYGLAVGLVWWSIGMVLAAVYFVLIYRLFWGKVQLGEGHY
jgi:cytochrome d ubiquinol oxidase subunit II